MLKLAVTALGSDVPPTVTFKQFNKLANFHVALSLRARRITPALTGAERSEGRPSAQGEARPVECIVGRHVHTSGETRYLVGSVDVGMHE